MSCFVEHDRLWMCQRLKYEHHKSKAIKSFKDGSLRYLSIIIDGMDQDKSNVPRSSTNAKEIKAIEPYAFSVVGVIVHGFEIRSYLVKPTWKHDTNLTIHLLMKTIGVKGENEITDLRESERNYGLCSPFPKVE